MFLDYAATYPNAKIRYYASDMILYTSSDAAYLVLPTAKSRVAGNYFLSNKTLQHPSRTPPKPNGPILNECSRIKKTVGSMLLLVTIIIMTDALLLLGIYYSIQYLKEFLCHQPTDLHLLSFSLQSQHQYCTCASTNTTTNKMTK